MSPTSISLRGPLRPSRGIMPHPPTASAPPRSARPSSLLTLLRPPPAHRAWRNQPSGQCLSRNRGRHRHSDSALVLPCA